MSEMKTTLSSSNSSLNSSNSIEANETTSSSSTLTPTTKDNDVSSSPPTSQQQQQQSKMEDVRYSLPKHSACIIRGKTVPRSVAERICVQTSRFPYRHLCRTEDLNKFYATLGIPELDHKDHYAFRNQLNKACGLFTAKLEYLSNESWYNKSIGADSHWINWDGQVKCDTSLRKCNDLVDVYHEWIMIAQRFPELELVCQIFPCQLDQIREEVKAYRGNNDEKDTKDGNPSETRVIVHSPVIQFNIKAGQVEMQFSNFDELNPKTDFAMTDGISLVRDMLMFNPKRDIFNIPLHLIPSIIRQVKEHVTAHPDRYPIDDLNDE